MRARIPVPDGKRIAVAVLLLVGLVLASLAGDAARRFTRQRAYTDVDIAGVVGRAIWPANKLGVRPDQLRLMVNHRGDGTFVLVDPASVPEGVQPPVWIVLDGHAYWFLGARELTPSIPSVLDSPPDFWGRIGYQAPTNDKARLIFER